MSEAVAMATGRELLAGERPVRPLRVLLHSSEDDMAELERRLAATLKHFGLTHADLGGRLFLSSGRDRKITLGRTGREGPALLPGIVDGLADLARGAKLDVITFDPAGPMLGVPENDNSAVNTILDGLRDLATRTGAAVIVLHHAGKAAAQDMDAAGVGAVRGASAFADGARDVRQLIRMTPKEADKYGIPAEHRHRYLRTTNGKANMGPMAGDRWYRLASVPLDNGASWWPEGDHVGVIESWTPPAPVLGSVSDLAAVQQALTAMLPARPRYHHTAREWVGFLVAETLGLDIGLPGTTAAQRTPAQDAAFTRVRAIVGDWLHNGGLVRVTERDSKEGRNAEFIAPGTAAICPDPSGESTDGEAVNEG